MHFLKAHKVASSVIAIAVVGGGIGMAHAARSGTAAAQYAVAPAVVGNIVQTVTGTGQVSAANQLDVTSQASGAITSIRVAVGDRVTKGQILATIDDTNARNTLRSAELSYEQLTQPAKPGDLNDAENTLQKSYTDALSSVRSAFTDLQTVIPGLNSILYDQNGYLGTANSVYLTTSGQTYRTVAGVSFDAAKAAYQSALAEYSIFPANATTTAKVALVIDTSLMLAKVAQAIKDMQSALTYIAANETQYHFSSGDTAKTNVSSWLTMINSDVSALASANNSIMANQNTLDNLVTGADPLQVQSAQLTVDQARSTYDNYFVRAPFDGIVGRIPVSLYSQASGGTVIATVIGDQKIANIALDEVDAAKVRSGNTAIVTFDAIPGFTATGTVDRVDLVGTVNQGVVSYNVRVIIDTDDERIRPGMSLNVSIVTDRKNGVLVVPSAAVKTQNGRSYVQVLDRSALPPRPPQAPGAATGTRQFASSTRAFEGGGARQFSLTVASATPPQNVTVTTGLSDDQNIEILSGLTAGQLVVTRTVSGTTGTQAAPSIINALGGSNAARRPGAGGGNVRIGG
jgi:HlyD family secretion protein